MGRLVGCCLLGCRPWLTLVMLVSTIIGSRIIHAAPLQGDTSDTGCYYMLQHYNEGDNITTSEPCLNCTCHNSRLKCFLQVCPFTKPVDQDCIVERREDQCCPAITCPPVPVSVGSLSFPLPISTTKKPTSMSSSFTQNKPEIDSGCNIDGTFYPDGAQVPGDPSNPCQLCYCIQNHTACVLQQCTLTMPGCYPVYQEGLCCPIRYNCDSERSLTTTTTTTTTVRPIGCMKDGRFFEDGSSVPADESCEFCYCMGGDIVCALPGCPPLPDQFGFSEGTCVELPLEPGQCCPVFNCSGGQGTTTDLPELVNDEPVTDVILATEYPGTVPGALDETLEKLVGLSQVPGSLKTSEFITERVSADSESFTEVPGNLQNEDELTDVPVQIVFSLSLLQKQSLEHQTGVPKLQNAPNTEPPVDRKAIEVTGTHPGTILEGSGHSIMQQTVLESSALDNRAFDTTSNVDSSVLEPVFSADIVTEKFQAVIREPDALEPVNFTTLEMSDFSFQTVPVTTEGILSVSEGGQTLGTDTVITGKSNGELEKLKEDISTESGAFLDNVLTTETVSEDVEATTDVSEPLQTLETAPQEAANHTAVPIRVPVEESNVNSKLKDEESSRIVPGSLQADTTSTGVSLGETGIIPGSFQTEKLDSDIVPGLLVGAKRIPGSRHTEELTDEVASENANDFASLTGSLQEEVSSTEDLPNLRDLQTGEPGSDSIAEESEGSESVPGSLQIEQFSTEVVPGSLYETNLSTEVPPGDPAVVSGTLQPEELHTDDVPAVAQGFQSVPESLQAEEFSTEAIPGNLDNRSVLLESLQQEVFSTEVPPEDHGVVSGTFQNQEFNSDVIPVIRESSKSIPGSLQADKFTTEVFPVDPVGSIVLTESLQTDVITTEIFNDDVEASRTVAESSSEAHPITEFVPATPETLIPTTSSIPGEGTCLVNGVTYSNEAEVPGSNPCQVNCRCQSSIVTCKMATCPPPPADFANCRPSVRPGKCCPAYDCDGLHGSLPGMPGKTSSSTLTEKVAVSSDKIEESLTDPEGSSGLAHKPEVVNESRVYGNESAVDQSGILASLESTESSVNLQMDLNDSLKAANDSQLNHDILDNTEDSFEDVTILAPFGENHEDSQLSHNSLENFDGFTTTETIEQEDSFFDPTGFLVNHESGSLRKTENQESLKNPDDPVTSSDSESEKILDSTHNPTDPSSNLDDPKTLPSLESGQNQDSFSEFENHEESSRNLSESFLNPDDLKILSDSRHNKTRDSLKTFNDNQGQAESQESSEAPSESSGIPDDSQILPAPESHSSQESSKDFQLHVTDQESFKNPNETLEIPESETRNNQASSIEARENQDSTRDSSLIPNDSKILTENKQDPLTIPNISQTTVKSREISDASADSGLISDESLPIHSDSDDPETLVALESVAISHSSESLFVDNQHLTTTAPFPVDPLTSAPSCVYEGKLYLSAQQIRRRDACDFCFCFRGDIICLQQSCPPPLTGCFQEPIPGYCCPRYECPVLQVNHNTSVAVVLKTGLDETLIRQGSDRQGCQLGNDFYKVGQLVKEASGPCLTCRCGHDGLVECDPQQCHPEPLLRKVIAFSADRRRRRAAPDGTFWIN